jgi:hypothetical protein
MYASSSGVVDDTTPTTPHARTYFKIMKVVPDPTTRIMYTPPNARGNCFYLKSVIPCPKRANRAFK